MIKNSVVLGAVVLIFSQIVCGKSNKCPTDYWPCKNGQCIRNEEVCDGPTHCMDGSDETVAQCLLIPCPSYAFQCAYGGCLTGNFKCNGIKDCADGSDESRFLCNTDLEFGNEIQGKCKSPASMECKSGQCISSSNVCDGIKHCEDGSDETVELCSFAKCAYDSFRCGYGACIAGSSKCNYVTDCLDGSDELPKVCVLGYRPSMNDTGIRDKTTVLTAVESLGTGIAARPLDMAYGASPTLLSSSSSSDGCLSHEINNNNLRNSTNKCPLYYWSCNNGQCIRNEELCNGATDCVDGSDETVAECLAIPCPSFAFRCTYGACITGNFKCNGIEDCHDGSDENRYLCNTDFDFMEEIQGSCNPSSMECKSGECIDHDLVCDGMKHCSDGSDETVELCSSFNCPPYAFRCGYGACIAGTGKCNAINDCSDGSDELSSICNATCEPITPTTDDSTTTLPTLPTTTERSSVINTYCSSHKLNSGISTKKACFYNATSVSCYHSLRPGTKANITCTAGYIERRQKKKHQILKCELNGEWNNDKMKCTPECGTLTEDQKRSNIKPWDLSIFKRNYMGTYSPICSGVIVSPKVVLTAARCITSQNDNGFVKDHVVYNVIEGYYDRTYSQGDQLNVKVHNISKISIRSSPRSEPVAVLILVNYFEFSNLLKPICLHNIENGHPALAVMNLNIGRPYVSDNSNIHLEYLTSNITSEHPKRLINFVNINLFLRFINHEIKDYNYLL